MTSSSEEPSIQRPREGFFGFHLGAEERGLVQSLPEAPRVPLGPHSGALGLPGRVYNSSLPASQFPEAWEMDLRRGKLGQGQRPLLEPRGRAGTERRLGAQFREARGGSEAEAELLAHVAAVALHYTAPVETAQAVLLELHALLAMPAAAAQQVAAAEVRGTAVAGAAPSAGRACAPVGGAEVG